MEVTEEKKSEEKISEEKISEENKLNVLIIGKTGVGKSTLINSLFNEELVKTGVGKPVTEYIEEISNSDNTISFFDTIGINISNYKEVFDNLENFIKEKNNDSNEDNHIHVAWLCISDGSSRIEDCETSLEKLITSYLPTMIVVTKSYYDESEFCEEIKTLCPNVKKIIPVNSKEVQLKEGFIIEKKNLDKLIKYSYQISSKNYIGSINLKASNNTLIKKEENVEITSSKNSNSNNLQDKQDKKEKSEKIINNYTKVMAILLAIDDNENKSENKSKNNSDNSYHNEEVYEIIKPKIK